MLDAMLIILMRMMTGPVELRPRSTGEIFALAFNLYRQRFPTFVLITSTVLVPIFGLNALLSAMAVILTVGNLQWQAPQLMPGGAQDAAIAGLTAAFNCVGALVWLLGIFWPWAEGALTFNVIEQVLGRALDVRASFGQTRRHWASLWTANFLAQIGIHLPLVVVYAALIGVLGVALAAPTFAVFGADFFASISPAVAVAVVAICAPIVIGALVVAVVLAINWTFRAAVIVGEGASSLQGLSRSVAIARGNRWLIFWRYVLLFILEFVVTAAPSLVATPLALIGMVALLPGTPSNGINQDAILPPGLVVTVLAITAISLISSLLLAPFRVVFTTLNYLDLRVRNENLAALLAKAPAPQPEAPKAEQAPPAPAPSAPRAGANWQDVDLDKLTPAQRVGVLFNRLRAEGESAQTLKALALALKDVGDWGGALDSLTRARNVAPSDPEIAYNLMVLYLERRNMTAASRMMQEYLRLETDPNELAALRNNPNFRELLKE
ncbi:MAG: tetratricopeptide repeat protein [Chloroflexi bacterium]|nr:MAG: tetratricopeptide repeat protein [Chloroflexota bacterium]